MAKDGEARFSMNFKVGDRMFTVRGYTPKEFEENHDAMREFVGREYLAAAVDKPQKAAVKPPTKAAQPQDDPHENMHGPVQASTLAAEVKEGKVYWKLQNIPGTRFGVNIWPEVLFDMDLAAQTGKDENGRPYYSTEGMLDPMETYDVSEFQVWYEKNEKGYPNKIVMVRHGVVEEEIPY